MLAPEVASAILASSKVDATNASQKAESRMPSIDQFAEFAGNHTILSTALIGSFMLLIFTEVQRKTRALSDIGPQAVVALMNANATVIDMRPAEQFRKGHLTGAKNFEGAKLSADDPRLQSLKEQTIVVVCDVGMSAARTAVALRKAGFENAFSLKGGITAWQQENLPLIANRKEKGAKGKGKKKS